MLNSAKITYNDVLTNCEFYNQILGPTSLSKLTVSVSLCRAAQFINPRHTCAARVAVLGLSICVSVCLSVCLPLFSNYGNEAARERYTHLQRNKHSKDNVADLAKTAAFWQEKPAPPWNTFHDPTHQLAQCACVFITCLGTCSTGSAPGASSTSRSPALLQMLLQVPLACFRTVVSITRVCSYIPHGSCCRSCVSQLLTRAAPAAHTNRV